MGRVPLTSGFVLIPEGTYVFRIYDAKFDEEFGKIELKMVTAKGLTYTERFSIKDANDEYNEGALNAFSYFAKTAMGDMDLEDIDPEELIDHYIRAEVIHTEQESKKQAGKILTFANLGNKEFADEFDEEPVEKALTIGRSDSEPAKAKSTAKPAKSPEKAPVKTTGLDLDALLG